MTDPIKRLEEATGPDRELDGEVWRHLNVGAARGVLYGLIPELTSSIDAAVALAERVLPGWKYTIWPHAAEIKHPTLRMIDEVGSGATPALALCIAILKAKEAGDAQ